MTFNRLAILVLTIPFASTASGQVPLAAQYYPLKVGNRWIYQATDSKTKETKGRVTIEVDREAAYERPVKDKNGKDTTEKLPGYLLKSVSGGKITLDQVVVMNQSIYRTLVAGIPINPPLLFFKLPLKAGETWEVNSVSANVPVKGTFNWKVERVVVPAGKFDAVTVSYREEPANNTRVEIDYWFAKDVGMVKQRVKMKGHEMVLELESFKLAKD